MTDRSYATAIADLLHRTILTLSVVTTLVAFLALTPGKVDAQAPAGGDIGRHLDAGEFAPARALADRLDDRTQRDRWLGQIAAAQARTGAARASLDTAADIYDDRARSTTLANIGSQSVGGWPARGGGGKADFEQLIELITSTVRPETWVDNGARSMTR